MVGINNGKNAWNPKQACTVPLVNLELSWCEDGSSIVMFRSVVHASAGLQAIQTHNV